MKFRLNKKILLIALCSCVLVIGIGFATLSSVLNINPSANVTPNSNTFSVVFTNTSGTVDDNTPVVPNNSSNLMTSTNGSINNGGTNGPELSGLSTNFISPGQTVTYSLYVYNNGEYDAYLTDLIYNNVTGESSSKICSPGTDSNNIQTNSEYVASACNGISITVSVGGTVIEPGSLSTLHRLRKGESEAVVVTIEYALGSQVADGPFTVSFGSIELNYSTVMTISGGNSDPGTQDTPVSLTKNLSQSVNVGDYIKMTPTINTNQTFTFTNNNGSISINPQQLDTWRVIRINNDGSIEAVSEYVTTLYKIYTIMNNTKNFYKNYIGDMNRVATMFENDTYTKGSRNIGFNGQTEYVLGELYTLSSTGKTLTSLIGTTSTPTENGTKSDNESEGGGDRLYKTDIDLVNNIYGSLYADMSPLCNTYCSQCNIENSGVKCENVNSSNDSNYYFYFVSGRRFTYDNSGSKPEIKFSFSISWKGSIYTRVSHRVYYNSSQYNHNTLYEYSNDYIGFRPILIFKPDIIVSSSQDGSSSNPYILE